MLLFLGLRDRKVFIGKSFMFSGNSSDNLYSRLNLLIIFLVVVVTYKRKSGIFYIYE